jgi:molecular chaperone GrpE
VIQSLNHPNQLSAKRALFLIKPCYYILDIVSTGLIFQVGNRTLQISGGTRDRMSGKKIIKIQSDSDEDKEKEVDTKAAAADEDDSQDQSEKTDAVGVDEPLKDLEARLAAKDQESKENYERLLRVSAEFENFKKRTSRELEEFRKYANQSLIKEMLSVVDNLELAMNSTNGHKAIDQGLLQGLDMTHKEILKVFEKFDVKPIEAKGQAFDPTFHEAVMQEETDEYEENTVVNELQKGYLIHDRLLRPAMVVVARSKESKDKP